MLRLHDPVRRRLVAVAVALSVLPACSMPSFLEVADPEDGVTVKNLTADLAFGADEVVPDGSASAPSTPQTWVDAMFDFVAPGFEFGLPPHRPAPPAAPAGPCPKAGEGVYPELPASLLLDGPPIPGRYRWQQTGKVQIIGLAEVPVTGLTTREVRVVPSATPGVVAAYEIEQTGLMGTEIDTIEIRYTDAGSPTDGVYLTRLQYRGSGVDIDFNPLPAAAPKLLSLPVTSTTEPISGSAVDPDDALVLQITGTMDGTTRHRLDACGELVEAWKFSGQRILQGLPPSDDRISNTTYEFYIAPQLGGLIVGDHVVTQGSFGPLQYQSDITTVIGDLDPRTP